MKVIHRKLLACAITIVSFVVFAITFVAHEEWPFPLVGWLTGTFFYTFGLMSIYNYLLGSHKGHFVYFRMLLVYLFLSIIFLIRSCGFFIGVGYWITGELIIFVLWMIIRRHQEKITEEKAAGIRRDYFSVNKY
ncbi:hypothetical protein [Xanthomonas albilineans]|uniref:hypothetical protein n=1 Tax=Xanthomonas albilineans TaxID=29447 RepID=UPI0012D42BBC|nr:hypothetical protein [Xanthomonas albilineans]